VGNVSELLTQVAGLKPGNATQIKVWRRQSELNLTLTPTERPSIRKGKR
jgi:S1-C subfamily serine protease